MRREHVPVPGYREPVQGGGTGFAGRGHRPGLRISHTVVRPHSDLCTHAGWTVLFCRVAGLDWRLGRVYFLAFLNPSQGQPDPALTARLASPATGDEPTTELD
jgi:hypothetical protein